MFKEELEQILTDHRIKWLNMLSELNDELISVPEMLDVKANIIEEALTSITNLVDKEICSMYEYTLTDIEKLEYQTKTEHPMISKTKLRAKLKGVRL